MRRGGFSLIEMLVAIGIASILIAIATPNFHDFWRRSQMDRQTRFLRGEIMKARLAAVTLQRGVLLQVFSDRFEVYSSLAVGAGLAPVRAERLAFPVHVAFPPPTNPAAICFDERGLTFDLGSICIDENDGAVGVDSVVVFTTRVSLGKRKVGKECSSGNITVK